MDPALTAEVVLRLGLVLESSAHLDQIEGRVPRLSPLDYTCDTNVTTVCSLPSSRAFHRAHFMHDLTHIVSK